LVLTVHQMVEDGMIRQADPRGQDRWQSYAPQILAGEVAIHGDCDDWGSTALALLHHHGAPLERLLMAVVSQNASGRPAHFVGLYEDDSGAWWTCGDTLGVPAPVGDHYWIDIYRRLSDVEWRDYLV